MPAGWRERRRKDRTRAEPGCPPEPPQPGCDEKHRDKNDPLPGDGHNGGLPGLAGGLQGHVYHGDPAQQREGEGLAAQGPGADLNQLGIAVPEGGHQGFGKEQPRQRHGAEQQEGGLYAEPEGLFYPAIQPGPVMEAAYRLKTLPEAQQGRKGHKGDPVHHREGGNGRIAPYPGCLVQVGGGQAGKALPPQAGQAAGGPEPGRYSCPNRGQRKSRWPGSAPYS